MRPTQFVRRVFLYPLLCIACASGIAACGANDDSSIEISGELVFNADAVGDGSTARVSMFEHGAAGGEKRIVAERTLHNLKSKPIRFEFEVARNLIDPNGNYGLRAQILDRGGDVGWTTRENARIRPLDQAGPVSLALTRVADDDSTLAFHKYECSDGFFASIGQSADRAVLRMGNRRVALEPDPAGSGLNYRDDHGNRVAFADEGKVDMTVDDNRHADCALAQANSTGSGSDANGPAASQTN